MSDGYTVFWTKDRCRLLRQAGQAGATLKVLFGGPHQSQPQFSRFGVKPGDRVYPVHVTDGVVHVLGRMPVRRLLSVEEYIAASPRRFAGYARTRPGDELEGWLEDHPEMRYLVWSCTNEVAVGRDGTAIRFDAALSPAELEGLRFRSRRGERGLKNIVAGRLTKVLGLEGGVYRLSPESAAVLDRLVEASTGETDKSLQLAAAPRRRKA